MLKDPDQLTLADVDGTIPGRAALVTIDLEDPFVGSGGPMAHVFVEGEGGCTNPHESAEGLWRSIADDWPTHTHTIVVNERANYLRAAAGLATFGIEETPQEYVESRQSGI